MTRLLLFVLLLISIQSVVIAQVPSVAYVGRPVPPTARVDCSNTTAGTVNGFSPIVAASNDLDLDTIFLCLGDSVFLDHAGDGDFTSGDPNPATQGGIGYAFYSCPPTVDASDLSGLTSDPCLLINPLSGFPLVYAPANRSGDGSFWNAGDLQTAFGGGNPVTLFFAPITYDRINQDTVFWETDPDTGVEGACLDLALDQTFAVVYLNGIQAGPLTQVSGCSGAFRLSGGLPEFDNAEFYTVDISLQSDPTIKATITNTGGIMHDEEVTFNVPQSGTYVVTVTDGKACPFTTTIQMDACPAVTFEAPLRNATTGQNICLPITTNDFTDVVGFQIALSWNTAVLQFDQVTNFTINLPGFNTGSVGNPGSPGVPTNSLTANWFNTAGVTLPPDEVLFEICFDVVGVAGQSSAIDLNDTAIEIEITNSSGEPLGYILNDGQVNISTAPFFLNLGQEPERCGGEGNGRLIVTVDQGTPPYNVLINTVPLSNPSPFRDTTITTTQATVIFENIPPGEYEVSVTDNSPVPVTATETIEVQSAPSLGVSIVAVQPSCFGFSDGQVRAEVTLDGVPVPNPGSDYTFSWNTTPANTPVLVNQPQGFYEVVVTSPTGCQQSASATTSQPVPIRTVGSSSFQTDASCSGANDGAINLAVTGGNVNTTNVYTFTWDNGIPSSTGTSTSIPNLLPGTYSVTITDDNNCASDTSFVVGAVKELVINSGITDVACFGESNGEIFISGATIGAPEDLPYTFAWNTSPTPPVNTPRESTISDLPAGTYIVTMTDASAAGCEVIDTFEVNEPDTLVVEELAKTDETCTVGNDGSITLGVTGGNFPYTYTWSHDSLLMDSIALGLSSDTLPYSVTVTDVRGCVDSLEYFIFAPAGPQIISLQNSSVSCAGDNNGTLSVTAIPGNAPIATYQWSTGSTQTSLSGLSPGIYGLTITAEDGCITIDSGIVAAPAPIAIDSVGLRLPSCPGFSDGQISLVVVGGTPPYSYTWSTNPGQPGTINPLPGLEAGTYTVTITDANNCEPVIRSIVLPDPPTIEADFSNIIDVSCPDDVTCDGQATATARYSDLSAGTFTFIWDNGQQDDGVVSSTTTGLCRGAHTLIVSDGNCSQTFSFTIGSPDSIVVTGDITRVSCNAGEDGAITISPSGGTAPYNILWQETGETTTTINGLVASEYTAVITDARGCLNQQFFEVTEPDPLILEVDPVRTTPSVTCNGDADGIFAVVADTTFTNPLPINPYTWEGGIAAETSDIATDLGPGEYSVTITDVKGCQDSLTYTITEPLPINFSLLPIEEPACFGESTIILVDTAFGGSGVTLSDYSFILNNDGFEIPIDQPGSVFAGENTITVVDPAGCSASDTVFINQPPEIVITLPESITIELGDSLTQLTPIVDPPGDVYDYLWTPATFLSSDTVRSPFIDPRADQQYDLLVFNQFGCSAQASIFVEVDANRNVFIPNAFSPDGDGRNDEFRIFTCRGVTAVNFVRIFDRWGNLVFESSDMMPNCLDGIRLWDGRREEELVNSGVFVYMAEVEFLDGVKLIYRGDVAVVR